MKAGTTTMRGGMTMGQRLCCLLAMGVSVNLMLATPSWGQFRSSMIDAVRGVTFHSVEISNDGVEDLNVLDGAFSWIRPCRSTYMPRFIRAATRIH